MIDILIINNEENIITPQRPPRHHNNISPPLTSPNYNQLVQLSENTQSQDNSPSENIIEEFYDCDVLDIV
jgi:hypothetical protein